MCYWDRENFACGHNKYKCRLCARFEHRGQECPRSWTWTVFEFTIDTRCERSRCRRDLYKQARRRRREYLRDWYWEICRIMTSFGLQSGVKNNYQVTWTLPAKASPLAQLPAKSSGYHKDSYVFRLEIRLSRPLEYFEYLATSPTHRQKLVAFPRSHNGRRHWDSVVNQHHLFISLPIRLQPSYPSQSRTLRTESPQPENKSPAHKMCYWAQENHRCRHVVTQTQPCEKDLPKEDWCPLPWSIMYISVAYGCERCLLQCHLDDDDDDDSTIKEEEVGGEHTETYDEEEENHNEEEGSEEQWEKEEEKENVDRRKKSEKGKEVEKLSNATEVKEENPKKRKAVDQASTTNPVRRRVTFVVDIDDEDEVDVLKVSTA
ncbi:hypothetical protein B0T16DRAFT_385459 [Cercophora newfieldiana]|uniref:Uncharacterized protein n=1 Tax=Cercophora newfieldiana TaxID=92897 RepID=A0AA39YQK0_9PEZI|nr:hypothetical protein B0T16DRAFT_385459 [Cercophora newfieldiana]